MADDSYRGYGGDNSRGRSEPQTDPLTELARLIGQSDPFGDSGRRTDPRASADWRDAPLQQPAQHYDNGYDDGHAAPPEPPQYAPQYAQEQHAHDGNGADGYARHPDAPYAQSYAGDAHQDDAGYQDTHGYGAPFPPAQQAYYREPDAGAYDHAQANGHAVPPPYLGGDPHAARPDAFADEAPTPRRRGWLVTAAALVGLAVIGTAGAFAYRAVFVGGPPPLITRDVRPDKVVPPAQAADNGAKQIERLAVDNNEQMAPPAEQPISIPTAPPAPPAANPAPVAPIAPSVANQATGPTAQPPAAPPNPMGPRRIPTVKIRGTDQEPVDSPAAAPPAAPAAPRTTVARATPPRVAAPPPPPPRNADQPLSLAPQGVADAPPASPPRAIAPPMRTTALAPAPAPGEGSYYVQVSAQKSQEEARTSFHNIQAKYASLLGGQKPVFRRKDLGTKGVFYGAQVGPFSREGAAHLCEQLRTAGGSCMIQRN